MRKRILWVSILITFLGLILFSFTATELYYNLSVEHSRETLAALPGVTPPDAVPGEEEIIDPGEEEGDVQEGTEETVPEEGETPEEGLEELPEEGETPAEEGPVDVPKTGDVTPAAGLALLLGLAVCAIAWKKVRAK